MQLQLIAKNAINFLQILSNFLSFQPILHFIDELLLSTLDKTDIESQFPYPLHNKTTDGEKDF